MRDVQQAFAPGDKESARILSKPLVSEHIATLQALLQREFTAAGRMQSATFAYWETFMQGVGTLLRLLRAEWDGLLELHLIAVCETIPWCRAADRGNYVRYLPRYLNDMVTLQQKPNQSFTNIFEMVNLLYGCLPGDSMPLLLTKRLNRQYTARGRAMEVSSGSPCGRAL